MKYVPISVLICWAGNAFCSEEIAVKLTSDFQSKYVWRGQNINNRGVLQPAISVSKYGFTGSIWGNLDLTNESKTAPDNSGEFSEFDFTLDYSGEVPGVKGLNFSVGTIYYRFPNTTFKPTTELYGGLSLEMPFSPSIKIYRDVDEIDGSYVQLGIGHSFEKITKFSESCYCGLQLGASFGYGSSQYNKGYFGVDNGRFNDCTVSAGFPICLGAWTVKPSINYSMMLSENIRTVTDNSDNLWAGMGISRSF